jgi:hypothetical protein
MEWRPDPVALLRSLQIGNVARRIYERLAQDFGDWVEAEKLITAAYDDRIDGGPTTAGNSIGAILSKNRFRIAAVGLKVEGCPNIGRRMVWMTQKRVSHDK